MNKSGRQAHILKLIRQRAIHTQEELARELRNVGLAATQVTLSRDIRELGLLKTPEGYQQRDSQASGSELQAVLSRFLTDVRVAQHLVVLRTLPAHASSIAIALDQEQREAIVGTVAGDDTVLVVTPDVAAATALHQELSSFLR